MSISQQKNNEEYLELQDSFIFQMDLGLRWLLGHIIKEQ